MYSIGKSNYYNVNYVDDSKYLYKDIEEIEKKEIEKFIKSYDLKKDLLYRIKTIKYSEKKFIVIMDFHHIIMDGISLNVFFDSISKFYNNNQFEISKYNYNDYVLWQKKLLNSQNYIQEKEYWKEIFDTPSSLGSMIVDNPEKKKSVNKSRHIKFSVNNKQKIERFCKSIGCTKFSFWISIVNIVLSKLTYQNDITIGTVMPGRRCNGKRINEFQSIVGMFVNTLPLRNHIDSNLTVGEFIKQVYKNIGISLRNSDVQYEEILELSQYNHEINPLFNVAVRYQNTSKNSLKLDNITCITEQSIPVDCVFDLTLLVDQCDDSFDITACYSYEMYKKETVLRMMDLMMSLSEFVINNSCVKISEIPLANSQEKELILNTFNDTKIEYPEDKTVVDLFEEQVEKTPDNVAVVFEDKKLTYGELNKKVNQVARKLRDLGVKPDDFVAIIAERSIEMIVGIYGIIKAGGAYVPIDTNYPEDRIKYMLKDCTPKAILVYRAEVETKMPVINLETKELWEGEAANLEKVNKPNDIAYCIYTSGTTGKPKGVIAEHKGIINMKGYFESKLRLSKEDKILQFANIVFSASVCEMTMAILIGGSLVIVPESIRLDVEKVQKYAQKHKVTVATFPPNYYMQMNNFDSRIIITIGSESSGKLIEKSSNSKYINLYGLTENTVCVTHWEYKKGEEIPKKIPIGKPINNVQIYILNENSICGIGIPGELCIAGAGVARGYINKPELTAEKFVDNPYGEGKLYRSGDFARWLPDGNIEYLGRIDQQVKIRGFRIELGEIESALRKIDKVKDVAVIAREDENNEKSINAYIVSNEEISISKIREELKKTLPDYMIPAYMMQIENIPVTRNGKLDKKALPKIEVKSEKEYVAPRNAIEEKIAKVFEEILGVERVGIKDNFFELGGHSLRATRVINRIEAVTGVRLSPKYIFENPNVAGLSRLVSLEKGGEYESIPKAEKKEYYTMSSTQKRIYLIQQMGDQGVVYNMPQSLRLRGEVNSEAIKNAMQELINRHEILRTEFLMLDGELVQRVQEYVKADFEFIEDKQTGEANIIDDFIRPFDLEKAPLFRVKLVKREDYYLLLMDMHHIIGDGMSMGTLIKEFSLLYNGNKLEPLTHQYKDYSEWMKTRDLSEQKKYWMSEFKEEIPVLDMPLDYTRPKEQSFKGTMIFRKTERELGEKIKNLAGKTGTTEYMIFLSAAMITLSKYSRQEDIVIGSPISGRTHKDTEDMLGMFVNTLAMRGYPEGNKKYREFLSEIKESCIKAYENQEYPFEELVEKLDIRRDMSRNPLFDVMLVLQNNEKVDYNLNGIRLEHAKHESKIAKFDLTFNIYEADNEFGIGLEYCTDLFKEESAQRILTHYLKILEQITENMETKISEIETVTEDERNLILKTFNNTKTEYPRNKTVVDLFEEQVEKTPDNVAVVFEDKELTYAELNKKANQVARKLRELGVKPDDFVAIMAERSIEMIVGIYGIIKAGGAYVPIDPNYPEDRIKYMLEDCRPKAVLVYKAEVETEISVINLEDKEVWKGEDTNLEKVNKPNDLVYCLYTSGTTGKPKGVMNKHTGLVNRVLWMQDEYKLSERDAILQKTTYTFDVSVWEIIGWSFVGAKVVLLIPGGEKDPLAICNAIEKNNVTMMHFVPSMLNILLLHIESYKDSVKRLGSLRFVFTGGETLKIEYADKFNHLIKSSNTMCKLVNLYGPTEASIDATHFDYKDGNRVIPIGKPVWNTQIYILDGNNMCGIGIPGELCIAGVGVARGYLNRPELTAEKFVDNPYGEGKLYRSGDLARWLPDGNIEYLGRIDEQVKVRGFRIELGEIESALRKIDKVKDATVIVREDENNEKSINAYLVSDEELNVSEIREELEKTLPDYMIPAYMMQIESIPVTKNGKLDKKALPKIEAKSEKEYVAPRNDIEEKIAEVFEEILGIEEVGIKDNFFELGGHSLRATRAINRIEAVTGVRLPLENIFKNPTVEGLSRLVNLEKGEEYEPIPKAEKKDYYTMSSTQKRTYLIQQMGDQGTVYNMPQSLRLRGKVNSEAIKNAMQELINRHEILRTEFLIIDGEPVQRIQEHVKADFEFVEDKKTQEANVIDDFIRPFDLEKAPLFRVKLVKRKDYYLLLIDMHHIIGDGMSMGTFIKEFSLLYNGNKLEPLTHQYKDYSEWMKTRDLSEQKEYWLNEFKEEIPVLDMPLDYTRPKEQSFKGTMIFGKTEKELGEKIKKLAEKTGTTEYMIFLSAAMITLSKYSRQEDIVIGSPISGRTHKDTEGMLGMFINTLAMRGYPEENKKYKEFLSEIKESCIKAYENQEYPFEELVEELDIRRDMSRNPLFDVMLVLQNNEKVDYSLNGIELEHAKYESKIAKFDLTFNIYKTNNEFVIGLQYCTDLFKEESAQRILTHYLKILEQITENVERKISNIEVITEEERKLILKIFNDTKTEYPKDKTVVDLFEEQVEKTPDNVAVVFEDKQLTYAELNRKVNQVARKLRKLGVKPNDFVAIMAERSIEMIIGIYGIIKAGGAYVPIDPKYPNDRIKYMLEDCSPKALVVYRVEMEIEIPVISLEEKLVWEDEDTNLQKVNKPNDLAYCIYTSGTTGKPKGVMIEHKGIISRKIYFEDEVGVFKEDKILQFANIVFDTSVWEITMAILNGGSLIIVPDSLRLDIEKTREYAQKHEVTVATFPPNYYVQMSDFEPRIIVTAGSESNRELVGKTLNSRYINSYGPTENTVCATHWEYKKGEEIPKKIPIGRPITNVQIYILNGNSMCGIGIPGELCIAGDGLARGYLNRSELTAEKFVENPYGEGKIYRSGDLARWLPDGNIEYLGRIDEQVKVRGFRIELGEIESVLRKIDKVKDAAVIAREDENKEKSINAYIVSNEEINISEIREELEKTLPEYMIPAYMMQIENIPVTRNGKLDKKALPKIEAKSEKEYIAPRNDIEEKIAGAFEEILGVEKVGIKDNFFELGGHSLRATRVINRIEAVTGVRLPLKNIFENSTVEGLSRLVNLEKGEKYESIPKAKKKEYYTMSSTQKRTYLIQQMGDQGTVYNMPQSLRLRGEVNSEAIKNAMQELINRHEILRTEFLMIDGEPVQRIQEHVKADFEFVEDKKTQEANIIDDFIRPFDLEKAPLFRVKLVKREDYYLLLMDMNHIIGDGMSMGTLIKEFSLLYNGNKLEPLTHQYKDYSEWMKTRDLSEQKEYWLNEFKEEIQVLDMPLDYTRPNKQSFKGTMIFGKTEKELGEKIKNLAEKTGTTEYMIFLSVAMITLSKYSRQEDIVIGSPISGRTHKDTEGMLGMFVNTLAMRGYPEGNKKYKEFLSEIKESCIKAYENQEYPFEELVEELDIRRDMSRNPLFDVMLVLQNNEKVDYSLNGIELEHAEHESKIAKFDLTFNIYEANNEFGIGLEYCTDLFKEESAQRILTHYLKILEQISENTERKISEIEAVTEEERKLILNAFNDTKAEYPKDKTVVDLFEEQVEKTPDNVAVVFEDKELTYLELNKKVNQVARKLRELGVKPDDFVGIMAERSIEMIIGIYGIIKAGGAYVPIDPNYPKDRIKYMLEDCKPKALVVYRVETEVEMKMPVINLEEKAVWESEDTNLEKVNKPNDLAYCIYTSGTTGKPKGVMVEHKGIKNMKGYFEDELGVSKEDKILQFANIIFDGSVWEITMAILTGGSLVIVPDSIRLDVEKVQEYAQKHEVTVSALPPSYYMQMNKFEPNMIITAGSESNTELVKKTLKSRYINSYGPTENTVCATHWEYKKGEEIPKKIPIGRPITNVQIYILNGNSMCGIGIPGELCIAGVGVARGYLNRPELTAEKFVDNPYGAGKMYRSGDLAMWLPDGNIEYLGRIDEQVKVRGFRIELGEIESALRKIDKVKDAAVIAREDENNEKSINAYIVSDEEINISEIREELEKTLPDYMIPAYIMQIESIPVTKNGKLDKKALPKIEAKSEKEYVAPRNDIEESIAKVFEEILGVEKVGIKDNFFELGGHSLRATRVINRIEAVTGVRLPLKNVFENPTVEGLSRLVNLEKGEEYEPIPKAEKKEYYTMSSAQKRTYLIQQMGDQGTVYNMPQSLRLRGEVNLEAIKKAMQELINRHEILRTEFLMIDGEPVQRIQENVKADFEFVEDKKSQESNIIDDFIRPFDLERAPLFRVKLVKREDCYLLLMDMHHIIGDGMSMGTLIKEFSLLYNGNKLEPLTHQYKDYSEWMKTRNLSEQKEYWLNEFKEEIPVLDMPLDYTRPKEQSFKGTMIFGKTEKELGEKIKNLASRTGTTEYMIFLSAAMITLSKYSRQEDIVIGSPISGRTHKDTEGMLGMFINTLAMRGYPEGNKKYLEFLEEIKQSCIKAYENQEYPFEELVEELDIRRDMSRNPLFDVMLVLQNNEKADYSLNGIGLEYANRESKIAKFDLTFNIYEANNEFGIGLEYCTDLFKEESAKRILLHYLKTLEQITENMESKISEIEVVTEEEKNLILSTFNDTKTEYPKDKTVVDLFEEQVEKTPDNVAVVFEDKQLTYAELNRKANQLARKLRELGVKPDDFVAIMAERSIEMIVGIYGVIKAGGAYVPIDSNYPEDRIKYMLEDCAPKAILVYKAEVETKMPVINLEEKTIWEGEDTNLEKVNKPNDLVYCIYTSGTTGKPKGVMNRHTGFINRFLWMKNKYKLDESDVILQKTTYTFDVSVWEIIGWSFIGAKLILLVPGGEKDPLIICNTIERNNVTTIHFVPSMLNVFLSYIDDYKELVEKVKSLKVIFTSGEALKKEYVDKFNHLIKSSICSCKLANLYGPTEASIDVTYFDCKDSNSIIPIGKPIWNTKIYMLNGNSMCGIGIPGELCIAGVGVARGYLNKPELTAEKFVKNPYGEGKMYRTGDLARWLPDGNIEYLGRIDQQVKIRGFRIELGEIESALRKIDKVKDAAVIAREDENKEKSINAYMVSDEEINVSKIREELEKALPDYMIPAYMMKIESIPVTKNGKLDRKALPKIEAKSEKEYIAPRSNTEAVICEIFSKILDVEKVGVNDDFFELGGHSLLAIKFEVEMNKYNFDFKVKDIFKYKTPYQIAKYITGGEQDIKDLESVNIIEKVNNKHIEKVAIDCDGNCIDNIEPFNDVFYKSCYYNALFPAFKHYNKNIFSFLINDVLVYYYNAEKAYIDIQYIECNSIEDILCEEGIDVYKKNVSDDIIRDVIETIRKDRPAVVSVDCYYSSIRKDTYKRIHWSHAVLVYGFNLNTKEFNVIEHNHRDNLTYSKVTMSFEDLKNSYLGYIKNFNEKGSIYLEVANIKESKSNMISKDELDKLEKETLMKNVLLKKEDLYKGLNKLQQFVQMYSDVILNEKTIKEKVGIYVEGINHIINAKYVEKYRIEHVMGKDTGYYKKIIEIIELWENVRIYLGKYMYSGKFIAENFKLSVEKMYNIIEKEKEFIEMFSK